MTSRFRVALAGGWILGAAVAAAAEGTAPVAGAAPDPGPIAGDAEAGARVFRRCEACHAIGAGAENKAGPILTGVVGRPAATVEGFDYSEAMRAAGAAGLVWTAAELEDFLAGPQAKVDGTRMTFPGLRRAEQRADVIAFLAAHPAADGGATE